MVIPLYTYVAASCCILPPPCFTFSCRWLSLPPSLGAVRDKTRAGALETRPGQAQKKATCPAHQPLAWLKGTELQAHAEASHMQSGHGKAQPEGPCCCSQKDRQGLVQAASLLLVPCCPSPKAAWAGRLLCSLLTRCSSQSGISAQSGPQMSMEKLLKAWLWLTARSAAQLFFTCICFAFCFPLCFLDAGWWGSI